MSPWDGKMDGSCTVWLGVKRQSDGRSDDAVGRPLAPNAQEADGGTLHGGRTARGGSRGVIFFYFISYIFTGTDAESRAEAEAERGNRSESQRPLGVYLLTVKWVPAYNVQRSRPALIWVAPPLRARRRRRRDRGKRDRRPHRGCRLHWHWQSHLHLHLHLHALALG